MAGEAQRTINVIKNVLDTETGNSARMNYTPGVVVSSYGSGYLTSVYVRVDELIEDIETPDGMALSPGDYIVVAETGTGEAWIDHVLPQSLYSKMAVDYERRQFLSGSGDEAPKFAFGAGPNGGVSGPMAVYNFNTFK